MEEKNTIEKVVHEDRLTQEILFQAMIKDEALQELQVKQIKELSRRSSVLVRNVMSRLRKIEKPKTLVTDKIANYDLWLANLLKKVYTEGEEKS